MIGSAFAPPPAVLKSLAPSLALPLANGSSAGLVVDGVVGSALVDGLTLGAVVVEGSIVVNDGRSLASEVSLWVSGLVMV